MTATREANKAETSAEIICDVVMDGIPDCIFEATEASLGPAILLATNHPAVVVAQAAGIGALSGAMIGMTENLGTRFLKHYGFFKDEPPKPKSMFEKFREKFKSSPPQKSEEEKMMECLGRTTKMACGGFFKGVAKHLVGTAVSYGMLSSVTSMSLGEAEGSTLIGHSILVPALYIALLCLCLKSCEPAKTVEHEHKGPGMV